MLSMATITLTLPSNVRHIYKDANSRLCINRECTEVPIHGCHAKSVTLTKLTKYLFQKCLSSLRPQGLIINKAKLISNVCFPPSANLVLHQTVERIHVGKKFGDIPRGIFVVRGENVVLLGEVVSIPADALYHLLKML